MQMFVKHFKFNWFKPNNADFITNIPDLFDKQTQNLKQEEKYEEQTEKVVNFDLLS